MTNGFLPFKFTGEEESRQKWIINKNLKDSSDPEWISITKHHTDFMAWQIAVCVRR